MGVRGLFQYCTERFPQIAVEYDLLQIARNQGAIEIIVDFYAFEYWISQQVSSLMANAGNPWVELSGGEYSVVHSLASSFIRFLHEFNINPIFVMDGAKFSTSAQADFKFKEWVRRDTNDYGRVKKMLDMVTGDIPLGSMNRREYVRLVLIEIEIVRTFRDLGVEIHCCCSGEADMYIAKLFSDRRAFGVLTNDSDFLLFPHICMVSIDFNFDIDQHLRNQLVRAYEGDPSEVHLRHVFVRCIKSNDVAEVLRLENIDQVCDFAFLRGNDASKPYADNIHAALKISPNDVHAFVNFVRNNQPLLNEPTIAAMCKSTEGFREAYELTHNFYKLNISDMSGDNDCITDPKLENFICRGVSRLNLPPNLLAMSRGYHWCRVLVELIKFRAPNPVSEIAMSTFRKYLYHMSVCRHVSGLATEFSVLARDGLRKLGNHIPVYDWLPKVHEIEGMPRKERLQLFHKIMTHQESGQSYQSPAFSLEFGNFQLAFSAYVCRYFLLQNHFRNLHIKREEMLAVIATVFGTTPGTIVLSQSISCKPSPRSLTVAAWLQNVYRYAGYFLARMLTLDDEIPAPHDFFSGSVFTAFFYCDTADEQPQNSTISRICSIKTDVLRRNGRAVDLIMAQRY